MCSSDLCQSEGQAGSRWLAHNLLHRHIKPAAVKFVLPKTVDFRSIRKMHASLLRRTGARPEIMRDNLGHAEIGIGLNVYSESWWDERVNAVSRAVAEVLAVPAAKPSEQPVTSENSERRDAEWVPFWGCPKGDLAVQRS